MEAGAFSGCIGVDRQRGSVRAPLRKPITPKRECGSRDRERFFSEWVVSSRHAAHGALETLLSRKTRQTETVLDPKLLAFIRTSIPSIWALELLLLLRRAAPGYLTREELVQHLRATPNLIDRLLHRLSESHLVARNESGAWRFECAQADSETLCEALALAADERPLALRDAIIAAPNDKLRDLADAFKFKDPDKEPKGGSGK